MTTLLRTSRLLTLTGAGGSGKTRLAREAAAALADAFEVVHWVELGAVPEPAQVPAQVAATLRVPDRSDAPMATSLTEAIGECHLFLVLDNCEHLIDACADLVESLLRACPRLTVLATSREALGVPGETAWLVPPLAPAEGRLLFDERARTALPAFSVHAGNAAVVDEICRRLDGIPLAIELAAARIRMLSPGQIAERLHDAFRLLTSGSRTALPRQRTLRGMMDWSYRLLTPQEQVVLWRLATFVGSFTLETAEALCQGHPVQAEDILDLVAALVDKSLVVMEAGGRDARYRLLDTVRQYAVERAVEAGEHDALRARHAAHYLAVAQAAAPRLVGGAGDRALIEALDAERGNLRAVAEWAAEDPTRNDVALRLGAALHWLWFAKGRFREGRALLSQALLRGTETDALTRGPALVALGHVLLWQGDHGTIRPLMEESVRLLRGHGNDDSLAYALNGLGAALLLEGDPAGGQASLDEARALAYRHSPSVLLCLILYWRGRTAQALGDFAGAEENFKEAVATGRLLGNAPSIAHPLTMLGRLEIARGRYRDAFQWFAECLPIHHEIEDRWGMTMALEGMATVAIHVGRNDRGCRLMAAADALRELLGTPLFPAEEADRDADLAQARKALGAGFEATWSTGRHMGLEQAVQLALDDVAPHTAEYLVPGTVTPLPTPAATVARLTVSALGPLRVERADVAIDPAAFGSAQARELLVLLLLNPKGLTKEQIGLALWPDASAGQLRNRFHVTLHRVRKGLGASEWVTLNNDRYRLNTAYPSDFDVATFQDEIRDALRPPGISDERGAGRLAGGLARYHGDFMEGEATGDWVFEHRDYLRRRYVEGLLALAAWHREHGELGAATEAYRRIVALEDLNEEAWRSLMLCLARQGDRTQALRHYQRLVQLLRRELDAEPEASTVDLAERLQQGTV